ncbi:hypothetical protein MTR67_007782 [Solanum verrucosum]|uniref:Tf2-1-like SH3-like domain-containing protein n=1 Tax=Solanum verrucosum TaxID=315347 RepID=A0AAF0Q0D9_SOLVR|nr:hypothetical protein MTR67_007782 [Solanum verrucosum]
MLIKEKDISRFMKHAQQIEKENFKEKEREYKRARIGNGDFSHSRSGGHGHPQFWKKFSSQGSSNAPTSNFNKYRVSNPKPQGGGANGSFIPIFQRCKTTQSRKKSYADVRRRELDFDVDDWVNLKISPMKGVMRFGKKGKLSPRYVGPYHILRRIGKIAYELELPNDLASMHLVFHVSLLKKCVGDLTTIVSLESLGVKESLSYEKVPVESLEQQVQNLRNKEVASVKVF